MNTITLLEELKRDGVILAVSEGQLVCDAPKGALTDDRLALLRRYKSELMAWLCGSLTQSVPAMASPAPSPRAHPTERIVIKDLSRDELVACIRELETEIHATPVVINEHWGDVDLRVELRALEAQAQVIRSHPDIDDWHDLMFDERFKNKQWVTLSPEEIEYYRVKPEDEAVELL